jgi:DNA-binding CsgD family transcriptional regulator
MRRGAPTDDELIDLIYAALLGEASWQVFLDRLTDTLPDGRSTLFFHDAGRGHGKWSLVSGFEGSTVARYDQHFSAINPWMPKAAVRPIGRGVVAEQMCPRAQFVRTEFYNDFMKSTGGESAVGVTIAREEGYSFLLSVLTARADPEANMLEAERLSRLAPHLRRAFDHYRKGARIKAVDQIVGSVFEARGIGILILGANGSLKSASPKAQHMIERDVGLRISPTGRVYSTCQRTSALLDAMTGPGTAPRTAEAVVSGPEPRSVVGITLIRVGKDRFSTYFEGPTVVVLIEPLDAGDRSGGRVEALASHFRLTGAERRVFAGLVSGLSVHEIADGSGVSRETVRTQLKRIYSKTGVGRQVDLVRFAGRYPSSAAARKH